MTCGQSDDYEIPESGFQKWSENLETKTEFKTVKDHYKQTVLKLNRGIFCLR